MKEKLFRLLAITVALLIVLSAVPFTSLAASPGSVEEVFDNVFLDALEYTGYNVTAQRNDGSLFVKYSSSAPASVRSNISYGTGPSGLETVVNYSTPSGLAPDIAAFERGGLCCASYVSYVYFNYLTNIEGIDTSYVSPPANPRSASSYYETAVQWINTGKARSISYTQNSNGSNFSPSESIPIGSLLVFRSISTGGINHVAVYAGYYNGTHFVTHVGNSRGPEICSVSALSKQIAERFLYKLSRRLQRREGGLEETYEAFRRMEQKKEYTAMYFYLTFLYGFMEWRVPRKVELLPASNEALKVFFAEFCNRFEEFLGEFQERKPRDAE